jgi:glycosyltransferase involved in cell wall biosynthesis
MRVVICWHQVSGYAAACFRELAREDGIQLLVVALKAQRSANIAFDDEQVMRGVPCTLLDAAELGDDARVADAVLAHKPEIVAVCGWFVPAYRRLTTHPSLQSARFVMGMDTPWKNTIRQRLGRYRYRAFFRRIDRVMVAGERTWQLARRLGFAESQLRRGFYGFDFEAFSPVYEQRLSGPHGWPRAFLFMGRYVAEKDIASMLAGYAIYRERTPEPWPLTCCGAGPLAMQIRAAQGVTDRGFVQPADQPAVLRDHGALVLMSRYEPWGVVLAEAAASGLPIICTEACGAAIDLVRWQYNGMTIPTGDAPALAAAMRWMHDRYDQLPQMGQRGRMLAGAYSAQIWAKRWMHTFAGLRD